MMHPKDFQLRSYADLLLCMSACLVCQRLVKPLLHFFSFSRGTDAHLGKILSKVDLLIAVGLEKCLLNRAHVFELSAPCLSADLCMRQCHRSLSEVISTLYLAQA